MKKIKRVIIAIVGLCLLAVGSISYVRYQSQIGDARPILKLLAENKDWDAANLVIDGPRLTKVGARKVWKAVIKKLATTKNQHEINCLFFVIIALQERRLYFQDEADWQVIKTAAECYNSVPRSERPRDFLIFKHEYDGYWLTFGVEYN